MNKRIDKVFMFLGLSLAAMAVCLMTVWAQDMITNRTGTVKITKPDGTIITVGRDDPLLDIPSGSIIEVLDGSIEFSPMEGFIQVVAKDSAATVKAGDRGIAFIDIETEIVGIRIYSGEVNVTTGNTKATIRAGQEVLFSLDKATGEVSIKSVAGTIETVTACITTEVSEGAMVKITADATTKTVHVKSVEGDVQVTSDEGETIVLAQAESIDKFCASCAEGEILTFAELPAEAVEAVAEVIIPPVVEEPPEPEQPEGSPFTP